MNPARFVWWRVLDDARFSVRFVSARYPRLGSAGVLLRWVLHLVAGNPLHLLALAAVVLAPMGPGPAVLAWLVFALAFEVWFHVGLARGGSWAHGWRLWWRVRRSLPSEWHESAAKSRGIKSAFGGENQVSRLLRPIADHPKTAWWPRIEWPVVSSWCGHPPGRSSKQFLEFQRVLAANILRVDNVEFDFARERDSVGRIVCTFVDVLAAPVAPVATQVNLRLVADDDDREVA